MQRQSGSSDTCSETMGMDQQGTPMKYGRAGSPKTHGRHSNRASRSHSPSVGLKTINVWTWALSSHGKTASLSAADTTAGRPGRTTLAALIGEDRQCPATAGDFSGPW